MKDLGNKANTVAVAAVWKDVIEPLLLEQQRLMTVKAEEPCSPDELKGFTTAYRAIEKFAEAGKEHGERDKKGN